jgi:anaerobic selenocysteine-containing dehydrogenase
MDGNARRTVKGYCGFCAVHCPVVTTAHGARVISVEPDREHPYGGSICSKGRAAPEFHEHRERVNVPLRRTRPKTDPDPGWEPCGWDEALDLIARKMLEIRAMSGAQAMAFNKGTVGGTALTDSERWLQRLINHFGTPNIGGTTHLCQWPRDTGGAQYTFGIPALPMPDVARSASIVLWGANPNANFLSLATDIAAAKARGAKLLVVDPRKVGLANKADVWLQVRPGTDGALALGLIHLLIRDGGYDAGFVREWTNAPFLVRDDTGGLLTGRDLQGDPSSDGVYAAASDPHGTLVLYDARRGAYATEAPPLRLTDPLEVSLAGGSIVTCRPVFERLASIAAAYDPVTVEGITGAPADRVVAAARLLAAHRPVSHYFHNGLVQHTNATQASRAIEILYALLGDFDRPGGQRAGARPARRRRERADGPGPRDGRAPARARRAADRSARDAGHRHRVRPLPGDPRRGALSGPRPHLVRGQHVARQWRYPARGPRPGGPRVLRPDRARPHADEPVRRCAPTRGELDGIARSQGRPPLPARRDGPRPVPRGRRPATP